MAENARQPRGRNSMTTQIAGDCYGRLASALLRGMSLEDGIYSLFSYMKDNIPFDDMLYYYVDRDNMVMNIVMEYLSNTYSNYRYSKQIDVVLPIMEILSKSENNTHSAFINDIDSEDVKDETLKYIGQLSLDFSSFMTLTIIHSESNHIVHIFLLMSRKKHVFAEEHRQLLLDLRPLLQQMAEAFMRSGPEPHLVLATDDALPSSPEALLRRCPGLRDVVRRMEIAAPASSTVLIQGPTGSGKELAADMLHALSPRRDKPLVKVNCGAIPETLLDSELFGFEKGAFTGAVATRKGYFEQAQGGAIYLDEIGELSKSAQVRLLRVLESQEIRRVGGDGLIRLDVRVVAATHRDLWRMVEEGEFREDLCYRLFVYPISIPALAGRPQDIPVLVEYFYKYYAQKFSLASPPPLAGSEVRRLMTLPWPGNVRQLRYAVERAVLQSAGEGAEAVTFEEGRDKAARPRRTRARPGPAMAGEIREALERSRWRVQGKNGAAAALGISPATLRSRMKALGIPLPTKR